MKKSDLKGDDFPVIPKGLYVVSVEEASIKEGKDSGKPYVNWKFKIIEGDHKGRYVFEITSLQEQAIWRFKRMLDAIGIQDDTDIGDPFTQDGRFRKILEALKDCTLRVDVDIESPQGTPQNTVVDYFPAKTGGVKIEETLDNDIPEWAR